jgi:hypothetical protein
MDDARLGAGAGDTTCWQRKKERPAPVARRALRGRLHARHHRDVLANHGKRRSRQRLSRRPLLVFPHAHRSRAHAPTQQPSMEGPSRDRQAAAAACVCRRRRRTHRDASRARRAAVAGRTRHLAGMSHAAVHTRVYESICAGEERMGVQNRARAPHRIWWARSRAAPLWEAASTRL